MNFEDTFQIWKENETTIKQLEEKRFELAKQLNTTFTQVVLEKKLLSKLPWELESTGRLACSYKDTEVQKFFDLLEWEEHRFSWHSQLKLGDYIICSSDGEVTIYFETMDQCIEFCKQHSIKPKSSVFKDQKERALKNLQEANMVLEIFSDKE